MQQPKRGPTAAATLAADAIREKWSVGTPSRFCDEVDWFEADREEIAAVIDEMAFLPLLIRALKSAKECLEDGNDTDGEAYEAVVAALAAVGH